MLHRMGKKTIVISFNFPPDVGEIIISKYTKHIIKKLAFNAYYVVHMNFINVQEKPNRMCT